MWHVTCIGGHSSDIGLHVVTIIKATEELEEGVKNQHLAWLWLLAFTTIVMTSPCYANIFRLRRRYGTSYNQPVYQIWILYVDQLRRYKTRAYVDVTQFLGDIKEDWGSGGRKYSNAAQERSPGNGSGGRNPQKLKLFCETTCNICIKIQQTSKILEGHYHGRPQIPIHKYWWGHVPCPIAIDSPDMKYDAKCINWGGLEVRGP